MKITRSKIVNAITNYLSTIDYAGQGANYNCWLNGENLYWQGWKILKSRVEIGDEVYLEIYRGNWYANDTHFIVTRDLVERYYTKPTPRYTTRLRDSQRQKVYNWEYAVTTYEQRQPNLTTPQIYDYIMEVSTWYGIKPPKWEWRHGKSTRSCYWPGEHKISLEQGRGANLHILLHELGHAIERSRPAHGPLFVGTIMGLYHRYMGLSVKTMVAEANRRKVKFSTQAKFFPAHEL